MRASLLRTGSVAVHKPALPGSPQLSLSAQASASASAAGDGNKNHVRSLHLRRRDTPANRALSETSAVPLAADNFGFHGKLNRTGSEGKPNRPGVSPESGVRDGGNHEIASVTGGEDRIKISAYYEEMLKSNPTDALLLGNYGKFLHEVEKDAVKAEEYYGRAILANPGDGEVLSLYGKLIWETQRDEERAKSYFDHAIHAAPHDCMVLGSYAHFMWEAEEEEEEKAEEYVKITQENDK